MSDADQILCIGSVLWDIIGRAPTHPGLGGDVGGRIRRLPGGVAMNIAMTLAGFGMRPTLMTAVGQDPEGRELIAEAERLGLETRYIHIAPDLPTDRYMAIECGAQGPVAAIADARTLEAAGDAILAPLFDGRLGDARHPYPGRIALDGNLTQDLLAEIAQSRAFGAADLRVAPASPGKAHRLAPLFGYPRLTLYVNRGEAQTLCGQDFATAHAAAAALIGLGVGRAVVSDGEAPAAVATQDAIIAGTPRPVEVRRITGAGDTLMAAHIAAEAAGADPQAALDAALAAAANYVSRIEAT